MIDSPHFTLAAAKAHVRQTLPDEDELIAAKLGGAVAHVEDITGLALVLREFQQYSSYTYDDGWYGGLPRAWWPYSGGRVRLAYSPPPGGTVALVSVEVFDPLADGGMGAYAAVPDPTVYRLYRGIDGAFYVGLASGNLPDAVRVNYTSGPSAEPGGVEENIIAAVMLYMGDLYANREAQIVGTVIAPNRTAMNLLGPRRVGLGI